MSNATTNQPKQYTDPAVSEATKRARDAEEAAKKAKQALRDAEEAAQRAKAEAAERGRVRSGQYLEMLTAEHADRRKKALQRQAAARSAFEDVIAGEAEGNPFAAYREVISAAAEVWGIDVEISEARNRLGNTWREPRPISLSFADDVSAIIQHLVHVAQDAQMEAIRTRASSFMAGEDARAKEAA